VLALPAKEPSHGYQLRARLRQALGPVGEAMNLGQIYVTLTVDRLISMRDGAFVEETRLAGGTTGQLAVLTGLDG